MKPKIKINYSTYFGSKEFLYSTEKGEFFLELKNYVRKNKAI